MKRTLLAVATASAVIAAPVAFAAPGHGHGHAYGHGTSTSPRGKSGQAVVSFVLRGAVSGAPSGASFTLTLKGANAVARKALKGTSSFTVLTDAKTHFSKAHKGKASLSDIQANDRAVVTIRAPRSTDATGLALIAASRVVDQGPKPH
jgi:hypothetical protein